MCIMAKPVEGAGTVDIADQSSGGLRWPLPEQVATAAVQQRLGFPAFTADAALAAALGERWQAACASAVRWRCAADWRMGPRTSPDDMFMLVESGRMWTEVGGQRHACVAGDLLHWQRHEVHSAGWTAGPLVVVAIHYSSVLADGTTLPDRLRWPTVIRTGGDPVLGELCWQAARLGTLHPPAWRSRLDAQLSTILAWLIENHGSALAPGAQAAPRPAWVRIRPAVDAMLANLSTPPGIGSLARRCRLSTAQFRRVFQAAAGASPRQWLGRRRIEEACRRLRDGQPIAAVAAAVGFAEVAAFTTAFRRATGQPPGRWREENAL